MGHKLTDKGLEPDTAKITAIKNIPTPTDKAAFQRFFGMCEYLSKLCPNPSETALPLRDLTKEDSVFLWSEIHETAFNSAKNLIASSTTLRYYDPNLPVTLQVDAFENAFCGILLQGPVCFTSHVPLIAPKGKELKSRKRVSLSCRAWTNDITTSTANVR